MKRLFALILLACCGTASAQSCIGWCVSGPAVTFSNTTTLNSFVVTVNENFTSIVDFPGVALDVEIYDGNGARVAQMWEPAVNLTAGQAVAGNPLSQLLGPGTYTVAVGMNVTNADGSFTNGLWNATATNFTITAGVPQVAQVSMAPCWPKFPYLNLDWGMIPSGVSQLANYYAAYVCTTPTGYVTGVYIGDLTTDLGNIVAAKAGTYTSDKGLADCASGGCRVPTPTELTFMQGLIAKDRPRCVVAYNGANPRRTVYTAVNGLPSPTGSTVAVGGTCDEGDRLVAAPQYYSVTGQLDQGGKALPSNSYTIAIVSMPIGTN